jgi:processive 1,2-diacylglycerol beta-glucosyltransferase
VFLRFFSLLLKGNIRKNVIAHIYFLDSTFLLKRERCFWMRKILLLPLLDSLPSGHHQVANAVMEYVNHRSKEIECKKIDILHNWSPATEKLVTSIYLSWIQRFPASYALVYRKLAYQSKGRRSYRHYELLFLRKLEKMISTEKPDLIICTHAFPSYLVNILKSSGKCRVPVLNIYTDFFINDVWGKEMVEHHFVADAAMRSHLMSRITERNIYLTGIPTSESISKRTRFKKASNPINIILSGGSAGLGNILEILKRSSNNKQLNYYVLCGNNNELYQKIAQLNQENVHPLPYLSSREKMNELYDMADAIITKPGGVTISEALKKKVPIFVHSALPGQEEINLKHLIEQGLVFRLKEADIGKQVLEVLANEPKMRQYQQSVERYIGAFELQSPDEIYHFIESLLFSSRKRGILH